MKVLIKLIKRLINQEVNNAIPQEYFGFQKGWSTQFAIETLLDDIEKVLRTFYCIFIYYTKAFNMLNRTTTQDKLGQITGETHPLT